MSFLRGLQSRFQPRLLQRGFLNNLRRDVRNNIVQNVTSRIEQLPSKQYDIENFYPGQIDIEALALLDGSGQVMDASFKDKVRTIDIFESIVRPAIYGEMQIFDNGDLHSRFSLRGDEYVYLKFKTPTRESDSEYYFHIYDTGSAEVQTGTKYITYTLKLVSLDWLQASKNTVPPRTFSGTISELVSNILETELNTKLPLTVEETSGIIDVALERRSPFSIIHEHYLYAENRKGDHMCYTFFLNKNGYHLTSIEKLIKDGKKILKDGRSDKFFIYTNNPNADAGDIKFRNILAYNQTTISNTIDSVIGGGYNNRTVSWDVARGITNIGQFIATEDGDKLPTSDPEGTQSISPEAVADKQSGLAQLNYCAINSEAAPNNNIAEVISRRRAMLGKLLQTEAQIMIYGDSDLTVGDVINCMFPAGTEDDETKEAKYNSGNYLVSHIRHMIVNGDQPQHAMSCNLLKSGRRTRSGG